MEANIGKEIYNQRIDLSKNCGISANRTNRGYGKNAENKILTKKMKNWRRKLINQNQQKILTIRSKVRAK